MAAARHLNISGNADVTDAGLPHLSGLVALEYLDIAFTNITDKGLVALANLTQLRSLLLDGLDERLTDEGLATLPPLARLEELRLNSTQVTDECVATIIAFKALKSLDISHTGITDEGVARIRAALPNCRIDRDRGA